MRIVLDTNVLVSGLLSPFGKCGDILGTMLAGECTLCVDARILIEYREVLSYERFNFDADKIGVFLDFIEQKSEKHAAVPLKIDLPDKDDHPFLEVALAARAECLVTGNIKHFPKCARSGVHVLSPGEFLKFFQR